MKTTYVLAVAALAVLCWRLARRGGARLFRTESTEKTSETPRRRGQRARRAWPRDRPAPHPAVGVRGSRGVNDVPHDTVALALSSAEAALAGRASRSSPSAKAPRWRRRNSSRRSSGRRPCTSSARSTS